MNPAELLQAAVKETKPQQEALLQNIDQIHVIPDCLGEQTRFLSCLGVFTNAFCSHICVVLLLFISMHSFCFECNINIVIISFCFECNINIVIIRIQNHLDMYMKISLPRWIFLSMGFPLWLMILSTSVYFIIQYFYRILVQIPFTSLNKCKMFDIT